MKKRRMFLFAFIFCAIIGISVGFANVTDTLMITGTAQAGVSQDNFTVVFDQTADVVVDQTKATAATVSGAYTSATAATIEVSGLTTSNQEVSVTYTIKNSSTELGANLSAEVTADNETYFEVTHSLASSSLTVASDQTTTDTTTITITVKLIKTPAAGQTSNISVEITATPVAA